MPVAAPFIGPSAIFRSGAIVERSQERTHSRPATLRKQADTPSAVTKNRSFPIVSAQIPDRLPVAAIAAGILVYPFVPLQDRDRVPVTSSIEAQAAREFDGRCLGMPESRSPGGVDCVTSAIGCSCGGGKSIGKSLLTQL
jgi:hypothetical protein